MRRLVTPAMSVVVALVAVLRLTLSATQMSGQSTTLAGNGKEHQFRGRRPGNLAKWKLHRRERHADRRRLAVFLATPAPTIRRDHEDDAP